MIRKYLSFVLVLLIAASLIPAPPAGASGLVPDESGWTKPDSGTLNDLRGISFGNGTFVAVGESGWIARSGDGVTWTGSPAIDTPFLLNGITFDDDHDKFVLVGYSGLIMTSVDGEAWANHQSTSGTAEPLESVAYGNGIYVAVGHEGTIVSSDDGENWTSRTSNTSEMLYGVAYGNGKFVAVGDGGTILISADGQNWSSRTSGTDWYLGGIAYGNGRFVAGGSLGTTVSSFDMGENWTLGSAGAMSHLFGVSYTNGTFMAVGRDGTVATSADGTSWRPFPSPAPVELRSVAYGKGMYVAVGNEGKIMQYTNTDLSGLELSSGTLSPELASGTTSYTASVEHGVGSIAVTPTVSDSKATVTVNGEAVASGEPSEDIPLSVGSGNTIEIEVTAEDGTSAKTYIVAVTRAGPPGSDADLSGLTLSSGTLTPNFEPGRTSYSASVGHLVDRITVTPTVSDTKATVTVNGVAAASGEPSEDIPLSAGSGNTIAIEVTAEDGTSTRTYTVEVTRAVPPSSDADLSGLALSSGTLSPDFEPDTTIYFASVSHLVDRITVTPTVSDTKATATVNGKAAASGEPSEDIPLSVGSGNTIAIEVRAEDGASTKTYIVAVTRAGPPGSDAELVGLTLSSGTLRPYFAPGTTSYSVRVDMSVSSITVMATPADDGATVTVNGAVVANGTPSKAIPLGSGNTIAIEVTAEDGTTKKTYTVQVTRTAEPPGSNADLSGLALSTGTLVPEFDPDQKSYVAYVHYDVRSIQLTPALADPNAQVYVNGELVANGIASGPIWLSVMDNTTITIRVEAEDGTTTKTYTIEATHSADVPSDDAKLSGLTLSAGTLTPAFAPDTVSYAASVDNSVSSIAVTPTLSDSGATVKVNGVVVESGTPSEAKPLSVGSDNAITVTVTAEDGTTERTYTVRVTRAAAPPSNDADADLSGLKLSAGTLTPAFALGTVSYAASVDNSVSSIAVTPTLSDSGATVKVNGAPAASGAASEAVALNVGSNTVTVVVTAKNGTTKTYTIIVTRAADPVPPSSPGPAPVGGGGSVTPNGNENESGKLSLPAGKAGEVSLEDGVTIEIPAGATDQELTLTIERVLNAQGLLTNHAVPVSEVFEVLKNFADNFKTPIKLTFAFDPAKLSEGQRPSVFYYDEVRKEWIEIGGTASGSNIVVEVDHFTKFAVFAVTKAAETEVAFSDIAGHWAEAAIRQAASVGIADGYTDGKFEPNRTVTRAEFAVMLMNAIKPEGEGEGAALTFADEPAIGAWAKKAIAQAVEAGIIAGYPDGTFRPDSEIARAEMAAVIAKALKLTIEENAATGFSDDKSIPSWARGAVAAVERLDLMEGNETGRFRADARATRAEAVTVLLRMLEQKSK
ncbi:cadherin-like beta sandwich domain-containing protein [Cohnella massiliensis]|uniref:cadherin-like beta sandwich domain-containing protein n=1 Tax=Cohnella massiliensis TaxID=1816691 RepID=UPI0009BBF527|nr:cadherin-like beta sandwich domain-containing protein [Cohnella massiliensis]